MNAWLIIKCSLVRREEERRQRIKRGLTEKKQRVTGIGMEKARKDSSDKWMKCEKKLKPNFSGKSSTKKQNELTREASKNQNKGRPCEKKTGTEFTSLLRKKEVYFTWDGMNGWFDLGEVFDAVSAYWVPSSTEWRMKGPIFLTNLWNE